MFNRYYTGSDLAELRLADNKIFGSPGAGTTSSSEQNVNNFKGSFGEAIIGNILNLIAIETPGLYVCHSIGMPDGRQGETDHVLIYRDKVILVETKAFSGYTAYSVNKEGCLKASKGNTRKIRINDNHAFEKVAYYQKFFTNRKVQAVLAVTRDQIKTYSENSTYRVASLDNIMSVIREEIGEAEPIKEPAWPAIKFFASLCISPAQTFTNTAITDTGSMPVVRLDEQRTKHVIRSKAQHNNRQYK